MKADDSEVKGLEKALAQAIAGTYSEVSKVVAKGALNIKTDAARRITGLAHARAYPKSIDYDLITPMGGPAADIGPNKGRKQGALGNLLEYGSVNNPPHPHMRPAAEAELPKFEKALLDLAEKQLGGR